MLVGEPLDVDGLVAIAVAVIVAEDIKTDNLGTPQAVGEVLCGGRNISLIRCAFWVNDWILQALFASEAQ
ncbi:hypothetical protein [Mesorhizobium sp.]|uniref:hypothetical protein n=1 Tax=Mesorhizobium sp. TaxID=1871066 RepID=UPI0025C57335|nr:hypothetical protein [Mesorhizobium sp.]